MTQHSEIPLKNVTEVLATKRAWQKGDPDRRREDRRNAIQAIRRGREIENRLKPFEKQRENSAFMVAICILMGMVLMCCFAKGCHAYTEQEAVRAIIGEAENQGYEGMLAVAGAIRNRGTLHGVYGLYAYRVVHHKYDEHIYREALKAWKESKINDITHGATGWGNNEDVAHFKKENWFPSVVFTAHIGDHWFYTTDN